MTNKNSLEDQMKAVEEYNWYRNTPNVQEYRNSDGSSVLKSGYIQTERFPITDAPVKSFIKGEVIGVKKDDDKLRYDLVSPHALEGLTQGLTAGANKYGSRNWEKGLAWSRVFAATMRHLWAWWRGESIDKETGLSHLKLALSNVHFLVHYESTSTGTDDRSVQIVI